MKEKQRGHRFNLVIPEDLWEPLQAMAAGSRRTVTSQIVYLISKEVIKVNMERKERHSESIAAIRQRS